jgi:four helix bundle protein
MFKKVEDLEIYNTALQLAGEISRLVKDIKDSWRIIEVNQILRSSASVPTNISEGFGQRFYQKQFKRYLQIALGSSDETQNHIKLLAAKDHISLAQADEYWNRYKTLSVKIVNLILYLGSKNHKNDPQ